MNKKGNVIVLGTTPIGALEQLQPWECVGCHELDLPDAKVFKMTWMGCYIGKWHRKCLRTCAKAFLLADETKAEA